MGRVCCQQVTSRLPETPTILKGNNNLIQRAISILPWKYSISPQGHRCKQAPLSYKWVTCNYLSRPYCKIASILQTSEHFYCILNQICIHRVWHIQSILKSFLTVCCHFEAKSSSSAYSPWQPSWKMAVILKTSKLYLLVSIPMTFHSTSTYQFYQTILFDCPLLFSK